MVARCQQRFRRSYNDRRRMDRNRRSVVSLSLRRIAELEVAMRCDGSSWLQPTAFVERSKRPWTTGPERRSFAAQPADLGPFLVSVQGQPAIRLTTARLP